jgi:hypothetical protein
MNQSILEFFAQIDLHFFKLLHSHLDAGFCQQLPHTLQLSSDGFSLIG